jgi:N-acyl-phosphatidylethanolamine-hydrolysing phospholipase D
MIPIGAYLPRRIMRAMHMNPDEAVRAFVESGCRRAMAMHWGTFKLTDEPMGEPPLLLEKALQERGIPAGKFEVSEIGTQWHVLSQRCL